MAEKSIGLLSGVFNECNWRLDLLFEPRDLLIGLYWNKFLGCDGCMCLKLYFILVPMLPLLVTIEWFVDPEEYAVAEEGTLPRRI